MSLFLNDFSLFVIEKDLFSTIDKRIFLFYRTYCLRIIFFIINYKHICSKKVIFFSNIKFLCYHESIKKFATYLFKKLDSKSILKRVTE